MIFLSVKLYLKSCDIFLVSHYSSLHVHNLTNKFHQTVEFSYYEDIPTSLELEACKPKHKKKLSFLPDHISAILVAAATDDDHDSGNYSAEVSLISKYPCHCCCRCKITYTYLSRQEIRLKDYQTLALDL